MFCHTPFELYQEARGALWLHWRMHRVAAAEFSSDGASQSAQSGPLPSSVTRYVTCRRWGSTAGCVRTYEVNEENQDDCPDTN